MHNNQIRLGTFSREELDRIIRGSSAIRNTGERTDFISRYFLNVDYAGSTLIGDKDTPEAFVINLKGLDCMTFIEYVEAMRLSGSFADFEPNLRRVRYRSGIVDFANRNHFFTDWKEFNSEFIDDVTKSIGGPKTLIIRKTLNEKEDGTSFISGIYPVPREIAYIPSEAMDAAAFKKMRTGDYVGIYSTLKGLDVSHVGILTREGNTLFLRHASSQEEIRKVVDQDFKAYIAKKPGIVVFRPKALT